MKSPFHNILPVERLGTAFSTFAEYKNAIKFTPEKQKEYSLVVVTEDPCRILIGKKHRGFGKGMYNSFGGKLEPNESDVQSASRELEEETGIDIPASKMKDCKIGIHRFTFADSPMEMIVHVYRVKINTKDESHEFYVDPGSIKGCDEITPIWLENWHEIPLHNMFADDSVWLVQALSSSLDLYFDGWFHFREGGQDANSISHRYLRVTLKQALHSSDDPLQNIQLN